MNYFFSICLVFVFSSCSKGQDLELEIVSKEINSLVINPENYGEVMGSEDSLSSIRFKKAKTIVTYKLKNNSTKAYFFNVGALGDLSTSENKIQMDKSYFTIFDKDEKEVKIKKIFGSRGGATTDELKFGLLNYDYNYYHKNQNFIIHPNETLYFEWFVTLPFGCIVENPIYTVDLNQDKKYEVELEIYSSNNVDAQKYLSRTELQMIKKNGYEIFNGTIKSKNRVPIKFIK